MIKQVVYYGIICTALSSPITYEHNLPASHLIVIQYITTHCIAQFILPCAAQTNQSDHASVDWIIQLNIW